MSHSAAIATTTGETRAVSAPLACLALVSRASPPCRIVQTRSARSILSSPAERAVRARAHRHVAVVAASIGVLDILMRAGVCMRIREGRRERERKKNAVNAARAARVGGIEKYVETPWILENAADRRPSNL